MRILVTGGAGFIGSHLCERLLVRGHEVTILDRNCSGGYWPPEATWNVVDCRELSKLDYSGKYDFVYHLASTVGVKRVLADPKEAIENIIESTRSVLGLGIPGMYFSTSEVYGRNEEELRENSEIRISTKVRWSYAAAKLLGEWLALQQNWKVIRPFNVVGARQSSEYGAVLPKFVSQALAGDPLTIYGDGSQVRTFINVRDFVEIVDRLRDIDFDVVNVGGVDDCSILQLSEIVKLTLESDSEIVHVPYGQAYSSGFEECMKRRPDRSKLDGLVEKCEYRGLRDTILEIAKDVSVLTPARSISD